MGIKFHCPNGHKLNVKSFLSGKKAICPKCGVKVTVPDQSEAGVSNSKTPSAAAPQPAPAAASPAVVVVAPSPAPTFATVPRVAPVAAPDPIGEAPGAVWYVRSRSGEQAGPLAAAELRAWLDQGRLARDSLVWRSGWPQWQLAAAAFPQLAATAAVVPQMLAPVAAVAPQADSVGAPLVGVPIGAAPLRPGLLAGGVPMGTPSGYAQAAPVGMAVVPSAGFTELELGDTSAPPARRQVAIRRASSGTTVAVSAVLGLLAIGLLAALVYVLSQQSVPRASPGDERSSAAAPADKKQPPTATAPAKKVDPQSNSDGSSADAIGEIEPPTKNPSEEPRP